MLFRATALLASLVCFTLFQAKPDDAKRSTVYGRAVYSDTEKPVGNATVVLRSVASFGPEQITGTTDGRGEFRIAGVRPLHSRCKKLRPRFRGLFRII